MSRIFEAEFWSGILNYKFGEQYFGFIAASYAITYAVLIAMVLWVVLVHRNRKRELAKLEEAGLRRASATAEKASET